MISYLVPISLGEVLSTYDTSDKRASVSGSPRRGTIETIMRSTVCAEIMAIAPPLLGALNRFEMRKKTVGNYAVRAISTCILFHHCDELSLVFS